MKKLICVLLCVAVALAVFPISACADPDDEAYFSNCVNYSDFGAAGDGKTDDFAAIKKAHEYANENDVAVKAQKGAKYYIGAVEDTITVKTSADWTGAEFIIDDKIAKTESNVWRFPLFRVKSDTEPRELSVPSGYSLKEGQENINLTFEKKVMLGIYNKNKIDFKRKGIKGDNGYERQEVILVDEDGKVDESTPVQWKYSTVTKITVYDIDDAPIMLRGGTFTTIANDDPQVLHYYERGILVERSNVTVKKVNHLVEGEGATGSPYNGFFRTNFVNNVSFENCVMTGRKLYKNADGNDQGTYDTRLKSSNNVRYINCVQSNDHTDPAYWGIMCSDYCRNLYMDGCKLSRFDAHMGVYNATITNSDIGQHISVTGGGLLKIENVTRRCVKNSWFNRFVTLREDYGSFFYGDIIIKDSTLLTERGINYVIAASWYDWDFGYPCNFPTTVTLDNVRFEYAEGITEYLHPCLYVYSHLTNVEGETYEYAKKSKNPPKLTEKIIIKNNVTPFRLSTNTTDWFRNTVIQ